MAHAHAITELGPDVGAGSYQPGKRGLFLRLVPVHCDEDARRLAARGEDDIGDVAGRDPWIGEFAFQHGADLLREGAGDSFAVMVSGSVFGHNRADVTSEPTRS